MSWALSRRKNSVHFLLSILSGYVYGMFLMINTGPQFKVSRQIYFLSKLRYERLTGLFQNRRVACSCNRAHTNQNRWL